MPGNKLNQDKKTMKLTNIEYEKELWGRGLKFVIGVDEVGRGCLAGPLVACAVAWSPEIATFDWEKMKSEKASNELSFLLEITDSKKVSPRKREKLADLIKNYCLEYFIVEVSSEEIDELGVGEANKKALRKAALGIKNVEHVLVDHFSIFSSENKTYQSQDNRMIPISETPITNGDLLSISIASASIIAKVYRDKLMREKFHPLYPEYGFDKHVGYGTKLHLEAISKYGPCKIHRKSFRPIKNMKGLFVDKNTVP